MKRIFSLLLIGMLLLSGISGCERDETQDSEPAVSEDVSKNVEIMDEIEDASSKGNALGSHVEKTGDASTNIEEISSNNLEVKEVEAVVVEKDMTLLIDKYTYETRAGSQVIDVPYEPSQVIPAVKVYGVNSDLTNIVNLEQYPEMSSRQKELLVQNGFFVMPTKEKQLFYIYEYNEYEELPSFITTDTVLQVYHIFYDYSLRSLEQNAFLGMLEDLNSSLMNKMIYIEKKATIAHVKDAAIKNIAFLATAELTLGHELPETLPELAKTLAVEEFKLITEAKGFEVSPLLGFQLDYSQYKPRGHYTRSDGLTNYFKTMMWYGQVPMPLYVIDENNERVRSTDQTLQAILLTHAIYTRQGEASDLDRWENIYETTKFYVGSADDLAIYDYIEIMKSVYGEVQNIDKYGDKASMDAFYVEADQLPEPGIEPAYVGINIPVGKQFRLMGQRFIPDSEIFQTVVDPYTRPVPRGLDVMAAMGSERAEDLLLNHYKDQELFEAYPQQLEKVKEKYMNLDMSTWQSNMYYGWLWTLQGLLNEYGEGYPSFMQTVAWQDKSLNTALGSWSQLKHDTVLYGKQSGAECGGGEEPPEIKGYVEPNLEVYEKLLWLNDFSRENLSKRGLIDDNIESRLFQFDRLLKFLITCSKKELNNVELTEEEYYEIQTYGGEIEFLTSSLAGENGMRWYEITSETDKNMAVIADVHTLGSGAYLEVGVGPAYEIYVAVPIGGEIYLTKGAIFSYFEFVNDQSRLTDEEWQKMVEDNEAPSQQDWIKELLGVGDDYVVPETNSDR